MFIEIRLLKSLIERKAVFLDVGLLSGLASLPMVLHCGLHYRVNGLTGWLGVCSVGLCRGFLVNSDRMHRASLL